VHSPYGPHRVGQNRQIALPADLMKLVRLEPGDQVYLQVNPELPGTLIVIPVEIATRWFELGRTADQSDTREPRHPEGQEPLA
jgi:antitoxin component of MazEF toxin-antitoxin module